jgi:ubiquinol-cytochrome c reductase cytochrome c subunit
MNGRVLFLCAALSAAALPALAESGPSGRNLTLAAATAAPSAAATATASPSATASGADVANGKFVFGENCATCHGANAEGGFGPNIRGVKASIVIYTVRNPSAQMGKIPITDQQLADVAAYVSSLTP